MQFHLSPCPAGVDYLAYIHPPFLISFALNSQQKLILTQLSPKCQRLVCPRLLLPHIPPDLRTGASFEAKSRLDPTTNRRAVASQTLQPQNNTVQLLSFCNHYSTCINTRTPFVRIVAPLIKTDTNHGRRHRCRPFGGFARFQQCLLHRKA